MNNLYLMTVLSGNKTNEGVSDFFTVLYVQRSVSVVSLCVLFMGVTELISNSELLCHSLRQSFLSVERSVKD